MGQLDQRKKPISRLDFAREAAATGLSSPPSLYPQVWDTERETTELGWGGGTFPDNQPD